MSGRTAPAAEFRIPEACERCGKPGSACELSYSVPAAAFICGSCHGRIAAAEPTSDPPRNEDREPTLSSSSPASPSSPTPSSSSPPPLTAQVVPSPSPLTPYVTPPEGGPRNGESEVEWLLRTEAAREVVPVELPPLPENATETMRSVAEFYRLLLGLRLGVCDDRAIPFASGWVGEKLGIPEKTVWRILKRLEGSGVLVHDGESPGSNPGRLPMHLWAPGVLPGAAVGVEGRAEAVRDPAEVVPELKDEKLVGANRTAHIGGGVGAVGRAGHTAKSTPPGEGIA